MDFSYNINRQGSFAIIEMAGNLIDKTQANPMLDEIQSTIDGSTIVFNDQYYFKVTNG